MRLKGKDRPLTDDRILGSGKFVQQLIKKVDPTGKSHISLPDSIARMHSMITSRCKDEGLTLEALTAGARQGEFPGYAQALLGKSLMSLASPTRRSHAPLGYPHPECHA